MIQVAASETALPDQHLARMARVVGLAGAVSVGFALGFLAFVFRWIKLEPTSPSLLWIGSYFAFSAICMLALGLRLHSLRAVIHPMVSGALPTG